MESPLKLVQASAPLLTGGDASRSALQRQALMAQYRAGHHAGYRSGYTIGWRYGAVCGGIAVVLGGTAFAVGAQWLGWL